MNETPHPPTRLIQHAICLDRRFNAQEYELLRLGLQPKMMEDKWFIYLDEQVGVLHFHRSWTGFCIFTVQLTPDRSGGWFAVAAWANGDPEQFGWGADRARSEALLAQLIELLLVRRSVA